jgi:RNA polymerase sigma-70 factor (ECF subfamily)
LKKRENIRWLQQDITCFDDTRAYRQLFLLFYPSLLSFGASIITSKESAEEIVSDVFITIWQKRQHLDKVENLQLYLFTAIKNECLNQLAEKKNKNSIDIYTNNTQFEFKSTYYDPEQLMVFDETVNQIPATNPELPPQCQLIFSLVKEKGLKYKKVAEV